MHPSPSVQLEFHKVQADQPANLAVLSLNRPECANAFNAAMIAEIRAGLQKVQAQAHCRLLIIQGKGKHFSAGADLGWMQASVRLSYEENLREAQDLAQMFEQLYSFPLPTLAVVKGAAFGGAVGLTACCDFALAADSARFCLSEVKLGLLPAVILPYLKRKLPAGQLKRLALSAEVFSGQQALDWGLVEFCAPEAKLKEHLQQSIRSLLAAGPEAQKTLKGLWQDLEGKPEAASALTTQAIARARSQQEGQEGLQAFLNKATPSWSCSLPADWKEDFL